MIKLSELKKDEMIIDENGSTYSIEEVEDDLLYFKSNKFYTTREYHAHIDAKDMIETAIEQEYCSNMYEDWDERILADIKDEDIEKIQAVLDDILNRNKEQNIAYYQHEEIDVCN